MKRVIATALTCLLAISGAGSAAANGTSFSLGLTIAERCSIETADTRAVSAELQLLTVAANCNLERFSIRIAGLEGESAIVRAEAVQGDVRIGAADQVTIRASRPGRQTVRVWIPADAAVAIPQIVA